MTSSQIVAGSAPKSAPKSAPEPATEIAVLGLTPLMRDALLVLQELTRDGVPPSYRVLARELGLASASGAYRVVHCLAARGWIRLGPARARSIIVLRALPVPEEPEFTGFFEAPALAARVITRGLGG